MNTDDHEYSSPGAMRVIVFAAAAADDDDDDIPNRTMKGFCEADDLDDHDDQDDDDDF